MKKVSTKFEDLSEVILEKLQVGAEVSFRIKGRSMEPTLLDGVDIVTIQAQETYKKYDIVLYLVRGKWILHRIHKVLEDVYLICGDNQIQLETVQKSCIVGKVIRVQRGKKVRRVDSFKHHVWVRLWGNLQGIKRQIRKRLK